MVIGQTVWIWSTTGEVIEGLFVGYENQWLKIDIGNYIVFKKRKQIFESIEAANAWQLVKRVKRLLNQGTPMEEVIFPDDNEAYKKALELFPEELI